MAFRIKRKETVEEGIKRVLREQMSKAVAAFTPEEDDVHRSVHAARKRCKKIRGLYRLVRHQIPDTYDAENTRFREAAKSLAAVRDAEAMIETYDMVVARFERDIDDRRAYATIRQRLTLRRNKLSIVDEELEERVSDFLSSFGQGREALKHWSLGKDGFKVLKPGLKKTYKRSRKAMAQAEVRGSAERFHEWRKRVKYHRFHVRTLRRTWSQVLNRWEDEVDRLGELLGDAHDLHVLKQYLQENRLNFDASAELDSFMKLCDKLQGEREAEAKKLGKKIYALKPKQEMKRLKRYWKAWRKS